MAKGADYPHHTHTGARSESGKTGRPGHGWAANTCLTCDHGAYGVGKGILLKYIC